MLLYTDKLENMSVMASACSESLKKAVIIFPLLKEDESELACPVVQMAHTLR